MPGGIAKQLIRRRVPGGVAKQLIRRRVPGDLSERLFAMYYPALARRSDRAGQGRVRERLLATAAGATLEIGAGSGANLPWYPKAVTELVLADPSPYMLDHVRSELASVPEWPGSGTVSVARAGFPSLPFGDSSYDTIVVTYVLCSIPDVPAALREIARVLKPDGRLLFLEHVRAAEGSVLASVQDLVQRPHRLVADGCRPNRRTERLLRDSPLTVSWLERGEQPSAAATVRPTIMGVATRDGAERSGDRAPPRSWASRPATALTSVSLRTREPLTEHEP
jgi:SAM-dependent methyltransferase